MEKNQSKNPAVTEADFTTILLVLAASFAGAAEIISVMAMIGSALALYILFFIIRRYGSVPAFLARLAEKAGFGAGGLFYKTLTAGVFVYIFAVLVEKVLLGLSMFQLLPKTGNLVSFGPVFFKIFAAASATVPAMLLAGYAIDSFGREKTGQSRPAGRSITAVEAVLLALLPLLLAGAGLLWAMELVYYVYPLMLLAGFVIITGCSRSTFTLPVLSVYVPVFIMGAAVTFIKYFHNINFPTAFFYVVIILSGLSGLVFLLQLRLKAAAKAVLVFVFLPLIFLAMTAIEFLAAFE